MSALAQRRQWFVRQISRPEFRQRPLTVAWRGLLWRYHRLRGCDVIVDVPALGGKMVLPPWKVGRAKMRFVFRERGPEVEAEWLLPQLQPGAVVIDAGAHTGEWLLPVARRVGPKGQVIAIEPAAQTVSALRATVGLNGFDQVIVEPVALSNESGTARFYHPKHPDTWALGARSEGLPYEEVEVARLDDLVTKHGLTRLDALKMDVEGAEELALGGGMETVRRFHPIVIYENNPKAAARLNLKGDGAWRILEGLGYTMYVIRDGRLTRVDYDLKLSNIICLPG